MSQPTVSAVVVTWNSLKDIDTCLGSLLAQEYQVSKIVVVDNNSSDSTADHIRKTFPTIHLVSLDQNVGFAKGNNLGIAECESDWILALNPDAYLDPKWVDQLMKFAGVNPKIGALTGKLLRDQEGSAVQLIDSAGIEIFTSRRVRDRGFGQKDVGQYEVAETVFGACAAAALYKNDMLQDIAIDGEIFPEYFFCYYEDADLAWRSWRRNWECWYVPQALGWHKRGASPVGSRFSRYMTHRNRLWLIARNESIWRTLTAQPLICVHELLMLLRALRYPYLFKAVWESMQRYGQSVKERKQLQSTTSLPPPFIDGVGFK